MTTTSLTRRELAQRLRCSTKTLQRAEKAGLLKAERSGPGRLLGSA